VTVKRAASRDVVPVAPPPAPARAGAPARARAALALLTPLALLALGALPQATSPAQAQAVPAATDHAVVDSIFAGFTTAGSPGCVVGVGRAGEVLLERAYGLASVEHDVPLTPASVLEIGSVSKQYATAAIQLLADEGRLSLDDDVRRWVPELPDFGAPITVRMLAHHTSGLRDQWGLLSLKGSPPGSAVHNAAMIVELLARQRELNFSPGARYLYSNSGYTLLGVIVERASGQPLAAFTAERLFRPLGLASTQWRDDHARVVRGRAIAHSGGPDGVRLEMPFTNVHGNGGLLTTVGDMLRWTEALHGGRIGTPGFADRLLARGRLADGRAIDYALGLSITEWRGFREVSHGGATAGYRAYLAHYPDERLTVALACNTATASAAPLARRVADVFLPGARAAALAAGAEDPEPAALAPELLAALAGVYRNPATHAVVRLEARNGRLVGAAGQPQLIPVAADRFVQAGGSDAEYRFVTGPDGRRELRNGGDDEDSFFVAMRPAAPTAADLAAFAGSYRSDELELDVEVALVDGRLELRRRHAPPVLPAPPAPLEPLYADAFQARGAGELVFQRDAAGRVTGFRIHAGRVVNLRFDRQAQ
jgi:CubicO group peptidase (beta-lactamase class C family)